MNTKKEEERDPFFFPSSSSFLVFNLLKKTRIGNEDSGVVNLRPEENDKRERTEEKNSWSRVEKK